MSDGSDRPSASNWEARQKHASFWQGQLNQRQGAALAFVSVPGILITIGLAVTRFSDVKRGEDWMILYAFLVG